MAAYRRPRTVGVVAYGCNGYRARISIEVDAGEAGRALFSGWEPCSRPRFEVELGLPDNNTSVRLPGCAGV
jgi:hypothetical protein